MISDVNAIESTQVADNIAVDSLRSKSAEDFARVKGHVKVVKTHLDGTEELVCEGDNVITINGIDWLIAQAYTNSTSGTRGANFLALSNNQTDTTASDTTFPGEITGQGLARVDLVAASTGSVTHTDNTNTVVLTNVFTATGTVSNIHKAALFYGASETQPIHNFTFASDTSLASGERVTVTWTVTLA